MRKALLTTILILCLSGIASAADKGFTTMEHPWVMRSVKALGMGNANYVKSNDKYAPFYNPAGLARIKEGKVELIPLSIGLNDKVLDFYSDYEDTDLDDEEQLANMLVDHVGELEHVDFNFYPAYARKNFVFGIFAAGQVNASPDNPVLPELNTDITADAGVVAGIGMSFLEDKLQLGIAGRFQMRQSYVRSFTFNDIASGELEEIELDDADEGQGVLADVGVIYNIYNDGINPRVGLAVNNLGMNSMGDAEDIPYSATISAGISPSYSDFITSDIIIDIVDVTTNYDEDSDWGKRVNFGAEVRFWDTIALRGGFHQGYPTYGVGLDLWILTVDYAFYTEEVGAYAGQQKDNRHALEFALGW
ncbi:MAG: hypothetical protein LBV09_08555, partial [Deferribacteraceae bacterium]|jgi:hypothetical protein|nr:hypothetical protein [Deferribacteraceae bacterium]